MRKIFLAIYFGFFLMACDDTFSTTVSIDPPEVDKQMVFGVFANNNSESLEMYVGTNFGILDEINRDDFKLENATVTVLKVSTGESFNTVDNGEYVSGGTSFNYRLFELGPNYFEGGNEYTFTVEHPDFQTSETTLLFPEEVRVDIVSFKYEDGIDEEGDDASSVTFDIYDDVDVENYYEVELRTIANNPPGSEGFNFWIFTPDPSATKGVENDNLLIADNSFNGEKKRFTVKYDRFLYEPGTNDRLVLNLRTVNEGFYSYSRTIDRAGDSNDNPFASPVQVFSNVNNALGAIGFRNEVSIVVDE